MGRVFGVPYTREENPRFDFQSKFLYIFHWFTLEISKFSRNTIDVPFELSEINHDFFFQPFFVIEIAIFVTVVEMRLFDPMLKCPVLGKHIYHFIPLRHPLPTKLTEKSSTKCQK
jgi:hypothetical protein